MHICTGCVLLSHWAESTGMISIMISWHESRRDGAPGGKRLGPGMWVVWRGLGKER